MTKDIFSNKPDSSNHTKRRVIDKAKKLSEEHNKKERRFKHVLIKVNNKTWVERRKNDSNRPISKALLDILHNPFEYDSQQKRHRYS